MKIFVGVRGKEYGSGAAGLGCCVTVGEPNGKRTELRDPNGVPFAWGSRSQGAVALSLAIAREVFGDERGNVVYRHILDDFVWSTCTAGWSLTEEAVREIVDAHEVDG